MLPLQDKLDDWRRTVGQLDKDHAKEYKKMRAEIKKKTGEYPNVELKFEFEI